MKVGLFNYSDNQGGAARASFRIHKSLVSEGLKSTFYVEKKSLIDPSIKTHPNNQQIFINNFKSKISSRIIKAIHPFSSSYRSISFFNSNWPNFINNSSIDIAHLNWINSEMMSIKDISLIKKPIIWTLHDMWPFLGAKHLTDQMPKYKNIIQDKKNIFQSLLNLDRWTLLRKKKYWKKAIQIITPSDWLKDMVEQSDLMMNWPVLTIPHPINTDFWKNSDNINLKKEMNINENHKIILFGADGGNKSYNKGFELLLKSIDILSERTNNITLCVFGDNDDIKVKKKFPIINLGKILDDKRLRDIYSVADVCAVASRNESFCQVAAEAQSCSIPVVAFSVGGLKDIVEHGKTGYLAPAFDCIKYSEYLELCLEKKNNNKKVLGINARQRVLSLFSMPTVAKKYINAYEKCISNG